MVCDICGVRDAMMVVQQVSNSGKKEIHICLQCASQRGLSAHNGRIEMSLAGLFESIAKAQKKQVVCPVCGAGSENLMRKQQLGCPECYNMFSQEIKNILTQHGVTGTYTGSMPDRLANSNSVLVNRMQLKEKLEQSVAQEEYEKAAMYRDRLKMLDKIAVGAEEAASPVKGEYGL